MVRWWIYAVELRRRRERVWLWRVVDRIHNGHGKPSDMELLNSVADNIQGRTICALGDAAAMPVRAMIKHFRHEFEALIPGHVAKTPANA